MASHRLEERPMGVPGFPCRKAGLWQVLISDFGNVESLFSEARGGRRSRRSAKSVFASRPGDSRSFSTIPGQSAANTSAWVLYVRGAAASLGRHPLERCRAAVCGACPP